MITQALLRSGMIIADRVNSEISILEPDNFDHIFIPHSKIEISIKEVREMIDEQEDKQINEEELDEEVIVDFRELLKEVRSEAGWRVSPRHLDAALEAAAEMEQEITVERLAELVTELHGSRSQRQRRNAELWRLLGAQLAARDLQGDPDAQLAFIGNIRERKRLRMSDATLLMVVTSSASEGHPMDARLLAEVAEWVQNNLGSRPEREIIPEVIEDAVNAALDERSIQAAQERRNSPPRRRNQ